MPRIINSPDSALAAVIDHLGQASGIEFPDHVLVKIPPMEDKKTKSGIILFSQEALSRIDKERNAITVAECVKGCTRVTKRMAAEIAGHHPEGDVTHPITGEKLIVPIEPGDIVHFHYTLYLQGKSSPKAMTIDGEAHLLIHLSMIHYVEKGGEGGGVQAIGQYILADPIPEDPEHLKTKGGIITQDKAYPVLQIGVIRHIGKQPEGFDLEVGQTVILDNAAQGHPQVPMPGNKEVLWRVRFRNIAGVVEPGISAEVFADLKARSKKFNDEIRGILESKYGISELGPVRARTDLTDISTRRQKGEENHHNIIIK